jgi:hypothetical protein
VNRWVGRFALQRLDGLNDRAGLIADNYAPHKHPAVTRWLDRHARFHMHYTPTSQQQK